MIDAIISRKNRIDGRINIAKKYRLNEFLKQNDDSIAVLEYEGTTTNGDQFEATIYLKKKTIHMRCDNMFDLVLTFQDQQLRYGASYKMRPIKDLNSLGVTSIVLTITEYDSGGFFRVDFYMKNPKYKLWQKKMYTNTIMTQPYDAIPPEATVQQP